VLHDLRVGSRPCVVETLAAAVNSATCAVQFGLLDDESLLAAGVANGSVCCWSLPRGALVAATPPATAQPSICPPAVAVTESWPLPSSLPPQSPTTVEQPRERRTDEEEMWISEDEGVATTLATLRASQTIWSPAIWVCSLTGVECHSFSHRI